MIMVNLANVWAAGIVSAGRLNEILETVPEVEDAPDARALPTSAQPRIVFENVGFHYNGFSDTTVLEGLTWPPSRDRRSPSWAQLAQASPAWST